MRHPPESWVWLLRLRQRPTDPADPPLRVRGAVLLLAVAGALLAALALTASALYGALTYDLPAPTQIETFLRRPTGLFWQPTRIFAADGALLYPAAAETAPRPYLPLGEIPPAVVQTTLAALDPHFWEHDGIVGPWWQIHQPRTLAQRLVERFLLADRSKDARLAWQERLLARQLTARYGQGQVLAWYLNSAAYGPGVYGLNEAAAFYFAKAPASLTWHEAAWLAEVLRTRPADPMAVADALAAAASERVAALVAQGSAPTTALEEPPPQPRAHSPASAPVLRALYAALRRTLPAWPAPERGLAVTTTLDAGLMAQAACLSRAVRTLQAPAAADCPASEHLALYRLERPLPNATVHLTALEAETGAVLAWYTTPDSAPAQEPVGSLIAPWVYAVAFSRGWGPASLLWDVPARVPLGLNLRNHDGRFHGPLRARRALANAYEVPLAALLDELAPRTVWPTVRRLGLAGWPAAMGWEPLQGRAELTPVQVAHGLSPFATLGRQAGLPQPYATDLLPLWWTRVRGLDGRGLPSVPIPESRVLLDPALAYLVTDSLSDGPAHRPSIPAGGVLAEVDPAAVALGRTPDGRVAWVAVWSATRIAVVTVDARTGDAPPAAVDAAARVLARAWWAAVQPTAWQPWSQPPGIVQVPVCDPSGLLPTEDCPNVVVEIFLQDRVPSRTDPFYRRLKIHRPTGLLATIFTPPQEVEERVFFLWPPEARTWAQEQGLPVPPDMYAPIRPPRPDPRLHLSAPAMFTYVPEQVPLRGVVDAMFHSYRIQVGAGPFPDAWVTVAEGQAPAEGLLGTWDATGARGLYTLQLSAVDADDRLHTYTVQVTVDGQAPRVSVLSPRAGERYCPARPCPATKAVAGEALPIIIQADDDLALAEVLAWLDGQLLARWAAPPFVLAWPPQPGSHTLRVEARDQAGHRTTVQIPFTVEENP